MSKQFVKAKPLTENKDKAPPPPPFAKQPTKKNYKKYEQKQNQQIKDPREHIKIILNEFKLYQIDQNMMNVFAKYPRLFCQKPQKPEAQTQTNYGQFLVFGAKKQAPIKFVKQMSSDSSDPDWASDEQKQIKLVSKKIDQIIVEKVNASVKKQAIKKHDQLQRHQKQFLQQYYRNKKHNQAQAASHQQQKQVQKPNKIDKNILNITKQASKQQDEWGEYDPKVGALITSGLIQKIQKGDQDDDFSADQNFSYQSEKSQKSSSSQDDDMFADEGPRTVTKTKQIKQDKKETQKQIVNISSHIFTQIAEQAGIHPDACTWIISNKQERYRVSTQYMNEYYRSSIGLSSAFPYVSLNHSQFVHSDEIQTDKGLEKLKRPNQHRRKQNNFNKGKGNPKPPQQYKQKK